MVPGATSEPLTATRHSPVAILIACLVLVLVASTPAPAAPQSTSTFVVDADGTGEYDTIQAAVDGASPGDTVTVRPGTYHESVTIRKDLTLVAPRGATLDGTPIDSDAGIVIPGGSRAAPVIDGFTITGYSSGIYAWNTAGDWTVRNTTIRDARRHGVLARSSDGDWQLRSVTIRNSSVTVDAMLSTGDWTIDNAELRDGDRNAVVVNSATGDWTITGTTIRDTVLVGVDAHNASGDWTLRSSTIRNSTMAVNALETSGDWTVRRTTIANTTESEQYDFLMPALPEGVGIYAAETTGAWTVHNSTFHHTAVGAIHAPNADPSGNTRENSWGGTSTPAEADCTGNVTCDDMPTATSSSSTTESPTVTARGQSVHQPSDTPSDGRGTVTQSGMPSAPTLPFPSVIAIMTLVILAGAIGLRASNR